MCTLKHNLDAYLLSPGFEGQSWCSCLWAAIHYWWASWSVPIWLAISPLQDYHSSTPVHRNLCQMHFKNAHNWTQGDGVKETVTDWLNGLAANFYEKGIIKLVKHLDKCLNHNGDYIEKWTSVVPSSDTNIIWMNKVFFCLQQNRPYFKNDPCITYLAGKSCTRFTVLGVHNCATNESSFLWKWIHKKYILHH
jgi:hypothetical protein